MDIPSNVVAFVRPVPAFMDESAAALLRNINTWNLVLSTYNSVTGMDELTAWVDARLGEVACVKTHRGLTRLPVQVRDIHGKEPMRLVQPIAVLAACRNTYLVSAVHTLMMVEPPTVCLGWNLPETVWGKMCGILQKQGVTYDQNSSRIKLPQARYQYLLA